MSKDLFQSPDYFLLDELLTDEQKLVRETVRAYVKKDISPIIEDYAQRAEFPQQIVQQLGQLGCFGPTVPVEYGGGGLDYISYGLMMQELERGDSGVRSTASVQGSLVMFPIYAYGNEDQRRKYLPKLASGEWLGCFGLTEPNHGSDPSGMLTTIKDNGSQVILNGELYCLLETQCGGPSLSNSCRSRNLLSVSNSNAITIRLRLDRCASQQRNDSNQYKRAESHTKSHHTSHKRNDVTAWLAPYYLELSGIAVICSRCVARFG